MTDEELITALRMRAESELCQAAANRIHSLGLLHDMAEAEAEALVKERSKDGEEILSLREKVEKLRGALMVARAHVANNAEGWSVSRGAARVDLTIVDAAQAEEGQQE